MSQDFNAGLEQIQQNGVLDAILKKYGLTSPKPTQSAATPTAN